MANPEIKTKLSVEGEREYRAAISAVNSELRELDSEQKLAAAQFEATGDAQEYAATKAEVLRKKVAAQQKAVDAAKAAIEQMTKEGVDPASDAWQKWRTKLNNAQAKLTKLTTEAESAEAAVSGMATDGIDVNAKSMDSWRRKIQSAKTKLSSIESEINEAETAIADLTAQGVDPNSEAMQAWRAKLESAKKKLANLETEIGQTNTSMGDLGVSTDDAADDTGTLSGKVNTLRSRLDRMDSSLDTATGSVGEQETALEAGTEAAGEYSGELQNITKALSLENVTDAIDKLSTGLTSVIRTAGRAAKAVWNIGRDSGEWAKTISDAAGDMGIDAETYQSWSYAADILGSSIADIDEGTQKITQAMSAGSDETLKAFNELGVATRNADGSIKDANTTFWETLDALGRIEDATKRDALAQKIFGESAKKYRPLIGAGSEVFGELVEEGANVAAVSNENVEALTNMGKGFMELDAKWQKTKQSLVAEMAPALTTVAEKLGELMDKFNAYLQTEEGQKAMQALGDAMTSLVDAFLNEDSINTALETTKGLIDKLTSAFKWISENGDAVKVAIEAIVGAITALKVAGGVLNTVKMVNAVKGLLGGGAASAAGGAAANGLGGAAAGGAASKIGSGIAKAGKGLFGFVGAAAKSAATAAGAAAKSAATAMGTAAHAAGGFLGNAATAAAPVALPLGVVASLIGTAAYEKNQKAAYDASVQSKSDRLSAAMGAGSGAAYDRYAYLGNFVQRTQGGAEFDSRDMAFNARDAVMQLYADELARMQSSSGSRQAGLKDVLDPTTWQRLESASRRAQYDQQFQAGLVPYNEALANLEQLDMGEWVELYAQVSEQVTAHMEEIATSTESVPEAMTAAAEQTSAAAQSMADGIAEPISGVNLFTDGANIAIGLANGINANVWQVINATNNLIRATAGTYRGGMMIQSPSKVMAGFGRYVDEGLAEGITGGIGMVDRAMERLVGATTLAPIRQTSAGFAGAVSGAAAGDMRAVIMMDGQIVGELVAPAVQGVIQSQISAMR